MDNLKVINKDGQLVVDSREVAEMVEKRHDHLIRDIKGYNKVIEDSPILGTLDFFIPSTYINSQNKEQPCYLLTKKGCDMVANKMTGEKGVTFTATYIDKFYEMENQLQKPSFDNLLNNPDAIIQLATNWKEEKEKRMLLEQKVEKDKPKVIFAEAVSASKTTILIGELAKLIKQNGYNIGQNRLFEWLRNNSYLIRRKGTDYNMPTQKSMEMKLFEVKETAITHSDGHVTVNKTPKVTGKGQEYFVNKFLGEKETA